VRPGRYAAADGSFARSAGIQTARGAALLVVAVLVGVLLLRTAPSESSTPVTTKRPKAARTTVPRPPVTTGAAVTTPTTAAGPRAPAQVSVLVANGTKVSGAASRVDVQLAQAGYNSVGTANATSSDNSATVVDFTPGYQPEAAALAASLSLPATAAQPMPSPPPVTDTKGANIVVVVGTDLASQIGAGSGPPATQSPPSTSPHTTTTVRHTATTAVHTTTTAVKAP
jgi:LytR cell envelope-related transcriptional attenuator